MKIEKAKVVYMQKTFADWDLDFLKMSMELIDERLDYLDNERVQCLDPDSLGVFDRLEYVTGLGFVACQTYVTAHCSRSKFQGKKYKALALGSKHTTGLSMIQLINAAANHWKHSSEWSPEKPATAVKQTLDVISSLDVDLNCYPVANMLYEMLTPQPARFANLLPFLVAWRDELYSSTHTFRLHDV